MAVNQVVYRLQDSESDVRFAAFPTYVNQGETLANYLVYAQAMALVLDAVTGSKLVGCDLTLALALPGGLKANPVAASLNERGGIIGFDTSGQFGDSVRIPAILTTIMSGDTFLLTDPLIDDLITQLGLAVNGVTPSTREGFSWDTATYGKKSFRRK